MTSLRLRVTSARRGLATDDRLASDLTEDVLRRASARSVEDETIWSATARRWRFVAIVCLSAVAVSGSVAVSAARQGLGRAAASSVRMSENQSGAVAAVGVARIRGPRKLDPGRRVALVVSRFPPDSRIRIQFGVDNNKLLRERGHPPSQPARLPHRRHRRAIAHCGHASPLGSMRGVQLRDPRPASLPEGPAHIRDCFHGRRCSLREVSCDRQATADNRFHLRGVRSPTTASATTRSPAPCCPSLQRRRERTRVDGRGVLLTPEAVTPVPLLL